MHLSKMLRKYIPRTRKTSELLNQLMLKRASRFLITPEQINAGEKDFEAKEAILNRCKKRWKKEYKKTLVDAKKHIDIAGAAALQDSQNILTDILFCHFAYGFTSDEYFAYELREKKAEERNSYISDRDRIKMAFRLNDYFDAGIFLDKYQTYLAYHDVFKREAILIQSDEDKENYQKFVQCHPVFIKKRVDLARGESVSVISLDGTAEMQESVYREIRKSGSCILEEKIEQKEELAVFHPSSVNTIRCVAIWGKDGVEIPYCILRTGRSGSVIDNASAGGISAAIDPKTGIVVTDGMDERNTVFQSHPDGKVTFKGYQMPEWPAFLALIQDVATRREGIRFIGWDIAYSTKGWCVVEGNFAPQLEARQVLCGGMKEEFDRIMRN